MPPLQAVQGDKADEPFGARGRGPQADAIPGAQVDAHAGGVKDHAPTPIARTERRVGGQDEVVVPLEDGGVGVA